MYTICPNIEFMAPRRKQEKLVSKPDFAREIIRRRDELGLSLTDIDRETNGVIYSQLLYRLENGKKSPESLRLIQRSELARVLRWSDKDLEAALKVSLDDQTGLNRQGEPVPPIRIPAFSNGFLAAGLRGYEEQETPDRYMAFSPLEVPKGVPAERLFMVQVGGDSMFEEGMPKPIPEGAWLMVERTNAAAPGQIVVAYLPDLDIAVVKQLARDEQSRNYLLRSHKVGGQTFWAQEHPEMKIQGVVRRVVYEF